MKTSARRNCSVCDGPSREGFLLDRRRELQAGAQEWIEGEPQRGFFAGLRLRGRRRAAIVALRCAKCGHLDLWAPEA